jgi:hypothetical protein
MAEEARRDRRHFLTDAAATFVGVASVLVSACDSPAPTTPAPPEDRAGAISLNHGHVAIVTAAMLSDGAGLTLEIQGSSIHSHALELRADDLARIQRGELVSVLSSPG